MCPKCKEKLLDLLIETAKEMAPGAGRESTFTDEVVSAVLVTARTKLKFEEVTCQTN